MKRKCSVLGCVESTSHPTLFTFPKVSVSDTNDANFQRCLKWIKATGNKKILLHDPTYLQNHFFICAKHFNESNFAGKTGKKLQKDSFPDLLLSDGISEEEIKVYLDRVCHIFPLTCEDNTTQEKILMVQNEHIDTDQEKDMNVTDCDKKQAEENSHKTHLGHSSNHSIDIFENASCDESKKQGNSCFIIRKCSAKNCKGNNVVSSMYSFPGIYTTLNGQKLLDNEKLQRCRNWVCKSGNEVLLLKHPSLLQNRMYLCREHFSSSQFMEKQCSKLKRNANPTIFCSESISQHQMQINDMTWDIQTQTAVEVENCASSYQCSDGQKSTTVCLENADNKEINNETSCQRPENGKINTNISYASSDADNINEFQATENIPPEDTPNNQDENAIHADNSSNVKMKRLRKSCSANGCENTNVNYSMFQYPKVLDSRNGALSLNKTQLQRFLVWVKAAQNRQILQIDPISVFKKHYLCSQHFQDDAFVNLSKNRLKPNAVPFVSANDTLSEELLQNYKRNITVWQEKSFPELCFDIDEACATAFETAIKELKWKVCDRCKEKFLSSDKKDKCLHDSKCWEYTAINNMDPGCVPDELQGLSFIEEQLIARVHPIISVFKLSKGAQYGYRGNIINFSQDVQEFANSLPHNMEDLSSVVSVRYQNINNKESKKKHHDFHVRSQKILQALTWLKNNNPFYKDIIISEENLKALPENENVYERLKILQIDSDCTDKTDEDINLPKDDADHANIIVDENSEHGFDDNPSEDLENDIDYIHESCVPQGTLHNQDDQVKASLKWPSYSSKPIDEFTSSGYIACAFPTLFPHGQTDFRDARTKEVQPSNYFKHLLRFHDDRFATHRTFRFFAFNSWMRWTALTDGNVFVRNNPEFRNMTASRLKDMVNENPNILKKIMFQASNLRGTKAFWHTRSNELKDMVDQLGLPTIFLTLSCADGHWPDLFKLITNDDNVANLTEKDRRNLIQSNPHIVDMFFDFRVRSFIKHVLLKKYKVVDYWYRIEYQHRGSPHLHGIFWIENAPDVSNLDEESPEKIEEVLNYFSQLITAVNPNPTCENSDTHPCRTSYGNIQDFQTDLAQLLNKVQRHTRCSTNYCLKFNKKNKVKQCRFKFPMEMQETSSLEKNESEDFEFKPIRNDPLLNKFNQFIIQLWRANIDIAPVISKKALISYLAKYISKCEVSSQALDELLNTIIDKLDENEYAKKAIQKLFIKSCAERDVSAQEVCHTMLSLKLYSTCGRQFVIINFSCKDWVEILNEESEHNHQRQSFIEKYKDRPSTLEAISLWDAASSFTLPKWTRASKKHIVRVFPRINFKETADSNESYYEQQVLLHVPWRNRENLKQSDQTWEEVWKDQVNHSFTTNIILKNVKVSDNEDEWESDCTDSSSDDNEEEWMLLSRLGPKTTIPGIELGRRDVDLNCDWTQTYKEYEQYGTLGEFQSFIDEAKGKETVQHKDIDFPSVNFSVDQKKIVDLMDTQIANVINGSTETTVKRVIVQGKAGTGKSLLIKYLTSNLIKKLGHDSFKLATPTGVSAILIDGKTLHSVFYIPKNRKDFKALTGEKARKFCNAFSSVKFLLLDEYSMIGTATLAMLDLRCKQATGNDQEDFGGLHVYLFGDIKQLPPVKDSPFYSNNQNSMLAKHGKMVCNNFQKCYILTTCHRQQDPDFLNVLDNLSNGSFSKSDYQLLSSRFITNVSRQEESKFSDAIQLFSTKEEVKEHNLNKLSELRDMNTGSPIPIARIPAKHNCSAAKKGTSEDAEGLDTMLYLSKGCKIMLRANLWVEKGLVNGAMGEVVDILYDPSNEPVNSQPLVILCKLNTYTGPGLIPNTNIVPIRPLLKSWTTTSGENCTRYQFPIVLCYACSIHKSQGLTLDMAVVNIGSKEFALGLSYVAFSRVRSLDKLLLHPFTFQRLEKLKLNAATHCKSDFLSQLSKLN